MALTVHDKIEILVRVINQGLDRPSEYMNDNGTINVGVLVMNKDSTGYSFSEVVTKSGGEREWSGRMAPKDMHAYLNGLNSGLAMKTEHFARMHMKVVVEKSCNGLDIPLYDQEMVTEYKKVVENESTRNKD